MTSWRTGPLRSSSSALQLVEGLLGQPDRALIGGLRHGVLLSAVVGTAGVPAAVVGRDVEVVPRSVGHVNARAVRSRAHLDGPAGHSDCRVYQVRAGRRRFASRSAGADGRRTRHRGLSGPGLRRAVQPTSSTEVARRSVRTVCSSGWSAPSRRRTTARRPPSGPRRTPAAGRWPDVLVLEADRDAGGHLVLAVDRVGDQLGVDRRGRVGARRPRQPAEERQPQQARRPRRGPGAARGRGRRTGRPECPASSPDKRDT